jgi:hypothetical protein
MNNNSGGSGVKVIIAIIGAIAIIIAAYIGYKAAIKSASVPIEATQTAVTALRAYSSTPTLIPSMNERDLADIFPSYTAGRAFEFNFSPAQEKSSFVETPNSLGKVDCCLVPQMSQEKLLRVGM